MRRYETVFIVNPSLSQEERQPLLDKFTTLISDGQGLLVKFDEWGHKRLAYEIKKQTHGYYGLFEYCGDGSLVKELERNMSLDDRLLKYMTACIAKEVDLEALKAEIEKTAEERAASSLRQEPAPSEVKEESPIGETGEESSAQSEVPDGSPESTKEEEPTNGEV
jgi:small subunit ribosomal protein S6